MNLLERSFGLFNYSSKPYISLSRNFYGLLSNGYKRNYSNYDSRSTLETNKKKRFFTRTLRRLSRFREIEFNSSSVTSRPNYPNHKIRLYSNDFSVSPAVMTIQNFIDYPLTCLELYLAPCEDMNAQRIPIELTSEDSLNNYKCSDLLLTGILFHLGLESYPKDLKRAQEFYTEAAEKGSAEAKNNLAIVELEKQTFNNLIPLSIDWKDFPSEPRVDYDLVRENLFSARSENVPQAWYNLGELYSLYFPVVDFNSENSLEYIRRAATFNFAPAHHQLGIYYLEKNFEDSLYHLKKCLNLSKKFTPTWANAHHGLACLYEFKNEWEYSHKHFTWASECGKKDSTLRLAWKELCGIGISEDIERGLKRLLNNANSFHLLSMYSFGAICLTRQFKSNFIDTSEDLGWYYVNYAVENGPGIIARQAGDLCHYKLKDPSMAKDYYRIGMTKNDFTCISKFAILYFTDFCNANRSDYATCMFYLNVAKDYGHSPSWTILGQCYLSGCGVKKSTKKAFEHFYEGAKLNDSFCQHIVGLFYLKGLKKAEKNVEKAISFFEKSASQNYHPSLKMLTLAHLVSDNPDIALVKMYLEKALTFYPKDQELLQTKVYINNGTIFDHIKNFQTMKAEGEAPYFESISLKDEINDEFNDLLTFSQKQQNMKSIMNKKLDEEDYKKIEEEVSQVLKSDKVGIDEESIQVLKSDKVGIAEEQDTKKKKKKKLKKASIFKNIMQGL